MPNPALTEADRGADSGLAEPGVPAQEEEQRAHITIAQREADFVAVPEPEGDLRRVEGSCPHGSSPVSGSGGLISLTVPVILRFISQ
jgi:hypothetical protein